MLVLKAVKMLKAVKVVKVLRLPLLVTELPLLPA